MHHRVTDELAAPRRELNAGTVPASNRDTGTLMANQTETIVAALLHSIETSVRHEAPYRHWLLSSCLPGPVADKITHLPFPAPTLGGVSGGN